MSKLVVSTRISGAKEEKFFSMDEEADEYAELMFTNSRISRVSVWKIMALTKEWSKDKCKA